MKNLLYTISITVSDEIRLMIPHQLHRIEENNFSSPLEDNFVALNRFIIVHYRE